MKQLHKFKSITTALTLIATVLTLLCTAQHVSPRTESDASFDASFIPIKNNTGHSNEDNLLEFIEALTNKGIDTVLIYSFGQEGPNAVTNKYLLASNDSINLFYEIKIDGCHKVDCSSSFNLYNQLTNKIPEGREIIYSDSYSNQYYYQSMLLYIKGKRYFLISDRNQNKACDETTLNAFRQLNTMIITCLPKNKPNNNFLQDSITNIPFEYNQSYTFESNEERFLDSLNNRGLDSVIVYSLINQNDKNDQEAYFLTTWNGVGISFKLGNTGLHRQIYCNRIDWKHISEIYENAENSSTDTDIVIIHEKIIFYIGSRKVLSLIPTPNTLLKREIAIIINQVQQDVISCFHLDN